jgi:hypothetical protein
MERAGVSGELVFVLMGGLNSGTGEPVVAGALWGAVVPVDEDGKRRVPPAGASGAGYSRRGAVEVDD